MPPATSLQGADRVAADPGSLGQHLLRQSSGLPKLPQPLSNGAIDSLLMPV